MGPVEAVFTGPFPIFGGNMDYTLGLVKLKRRVISAPADVFKILEPYRNMQKEALLVLHLHPDQSSDVLQKAAIGNSESCCFDTSDIFREAILQEASGIILAHNHPWQRRIEPTEEDISMTRAMIRVGKAAKMPLLDHIVFGRDGFYSFRVKGKVIRAGNIYEIRKSSKTRIKSTILRAIHRMSTGFIIR